MFVKKLSGNGLVDCAKKLVPSLKNSRGSRSDGNGRITAGRIWEGLVKRRYNEEHKRTGRSREILSF